MGKPQKTEDRKQTENQTLGLSFTKSWGSALWFLASPSEKAETEKPKNRKTDKPKTWVKFHRELSIRTVGKNKNSGKASQPASGAHLARMIGLVLVYPSDAPTQPHEESSSVLQSSFD